MSALWYGRENGSGIPTGESLFSDGEPRYDGVTLWSTRPWELHELKRKEARDAIRRTLCGAEYAWRWRSPPGPCVYVPWDGRGSVEVDGRPLSPEHQDACRRSGALDRVREHSELLAVSELREAFSFVRFLTRGMVET